MRIVLGKIICKCSVTIALLLLHLCRKITPRTESYDARRRWLELTAARYSGHTENGRTLWYDSGLGGLIPELVRYGDAI